MRISSDGSEIWELFLELFCPPRVNGDEGEPGPPAEPKFDARWGGSGYVRPAETLGKAYDTAKDKD